MKPFAHRMKHIETEVLDDDPAASDTFDPDPSHYRLIICRIVIPEQEPVDAALARWGLQRADIPAGVFVYLAPCYHRHIHHPPVLLCTRPRGLSKDHARLLTAALGQSEEEREQQRQACWARDRETLQKLREQPTAQ